MKLEKMCDLSEGDRDQVIEAREVMYGLVYCGDWCKCVFPVGWYVTPWGDDDSGTAI